MWTIRASYALRQRVCTAPTQQVRLATSSRSSDGVEGSEKEALVYPVSGSTEHHDLDSFLEYAERSGVDTNSPVYVGTHYEYTVASALTKYGFSLRRTGGRSDSGIDLVGTWTVPTLPEPLRVLLQCKSCKKPSPSLVRELEGTFVGGPPGWRGPSVLAFLVLQSPATKGMQEGLGRSRWPMGTIMCSQSGQVQQMLWNQRAKDHALDGLGVALRHLRGERGKQIALTWRGTPLPYAESSP